MNYKEALKKILEMNLENNFDSTFKNLYWRAKWIAKEALEQSEPRMFSGLELATLFHDTYERLAPEFGYTTREDTKVFEQNSANGKLMVAVCKVILQYLSPKEGKEEEVIGNELKSEYAYLSTPSNHIKLSNEDWKEWDLGAELEKTHSLARKQVIEELESWAKEEWFGAKEDDITYHEHVVNADELLTKLSQLKITK